MPLPRVVVDTLAAHLTAYPVESEGPLFTIDGQPISRQKLGHMWRPVVSDAGLPKGTGFHALRHYYASLLIRHGESVKPVQARLGHASAVETLDTYSSHLWPDSDDRTREAIDSVLGAPADSVRTGSDFQARCADQKPSADGLAHRPGSVRRTASRRHGWRPSISGCRCRQPPATYPRARADRPRTLAVWSCSRWGLPSHDGLPPRWWSLAPPFHPYLRSEDRRRSVFCGTDPAGCPGWVLPTTSSCGARTFLDTSRLPAW